MAKLAIIGRGGHAGESYAPVPLGEGSAAAALAVRQRLALGPDDRAEVEEIVDQLGWRLRDVELLENGRGLQAGITPIRGGEFSVVVDSQPLTREAWEVAFVGLALASSARRRFRVAHEIAHSFFYGPPRLQQDLPSRTSTPDRSEEEFCDDFAMHLLIGSGVDPAAVTSVPDVVRSAQRLGVPVGVLLAKLGVPALAGLLEPLDSGSPKITIQAAWELDDSWVLWHRRPALKQQLIEAGHGLDRAVGFIAICAKEADPLIAIVPWTHEAEVTRSGYRLVCDGEAHTMGSAV